MLPYKSGTVRITSKYGMRTLNGITAMHGGLDLVGSNKEIISICDGVVEKSSLVNDKSDINWQVGNYVRILSDDGNKHYFFHLSERKVKEGQRVIKGQVIGIEGSTGYSTGSHLHFEIRRNGNAINTAEYLGIPNVIGTILTINDENMKKSEDKLMKNRNIPADWAKEALEWAKDNGVIYGDEHGNLGLDNPCTREQMIVFLHRLYTKFIKTE
jgi:hypothetical protein